MLNNPSEAVWCRNSHITELNQDMKNRPQESKEWRERGCKGKM